MKVRVDIRRKDGLADPEGATTGRALRDLGFAVDDVHFGRIITLDVEADTVETARALTEEMCAKLLANPVIESYTVEVLG